MCRNIKTLANFMPPATDQEIRASALQFVRKLSGTTKPSRANDAAFQQAVDEITEAAHRLLHSLTTSAPPRNREIEAEKARERSRPRFGKAPPGASWGEVTFPAPPPPRRWFPAALAAIALAMAAGAPLVSASPSHRPRITSPDGEWRCLAAFPRDKHTAIYDAAQHRMIVFG